MLKKGFQFALASVLLFAVGQVFAADSVVALPDSEKAAARVTLLSKINPNDVIVYPAKNVKTPKAVVYVFTDMDCTYCRKLHEEVAKANDLGIELRYVAYPRHGKGSQTYNKMVTVWCASNPKDRKNMMDQAMQGAELSITSCDHIVDDHRSLGRQLGLSGTPTLVFEDGVVWSGYLPTGQRLAREAIKHSVKH